MDQAVRDFKKMLHKKICRLKEASSIEKCDVILLFCPIVSRAGSDIDAAVKQLNQAASMPVIMVVIHFTFDPEKTIPDSSDAISRENTFVVDVLFAQGDGFVKCQKNADAFKKTVQHLKSKKLRSYYCINKDHPSTSTEKTPLISREGSEPRRRQKLCCCFGRWLCCCCGCCAED